MIKVSVILPVYGVAAYIEKCTYSLLSQTLAEMEFIFVDDHSPDESISIVHKIIDKHPRNNQFIFLKPEQNLGAGMARNYALSFAHGEYVAFVDSDDWVESSMFEELYTTAKREDSDICCCEMIKCFPNGTKGEILRNPKVPSGYLDHQSKSFILTHYVSLFASILYKRSFLIENNIMFSPDRSADDSVFVTSVWLMAQSVTYVDKPLYNYLIRPGSICTTKQSDKYRKRIASMNRVLSYAIEHQIYMEYKDEIDFLFIKKGYISTVMNYIVNSSKPQQSAFDEIYSNLQEQIPDYASNRFFKSDITIRLLTLFLTKHPLCIAGILRKYAVKNQLTV